MTSLKKLLAFNMKEQRRIFGISQAALAERINTFSFNAGTHSGGFRDRPAGAVFHAEYSSRITEKSSKDSFGRNGKSANQNN